MRWNTIVNHKPKSPKKQGKDQQIRKHLTNKYLSEVIVDME